MTAHPSLTEGRRDVGPIGGRVGDMLMRGRRRILEREIRSRLGIISAMGDSWDREQQDIKCGVIGRCLN